MRKFQCLKCDKNFYTSHPTRQCCLRCTGGNTPQFEIGQIKMVCRRCKGALIRRAWVSFPGDDMPSLVCGSCADSVNEPKQGA